MNRSNPSPRSFSADQLHAALGDIGGPTRPDYLADIVAQAGRTRQRPAWTFLERWLSMDIAARRQGVPRAAVLFAVLFLLVALLAAGAVYVGSRSPIALPADGEVDPGWYSVTVDGYRYTFRVPGSGWNANVVTTAQAESDDTPDLADVELTQGDASTDSPDLAGFGLWGNVTEVNVLCQEVIGPWLVGPTADDLAIAIASHQGVTSSEPADVTVGRYSGKRLQRVVPGDWPACTEGAYRYGYVSFADEDGKHRKDQGPGQVDDIWILDLDNGHRQLFLITYFPTTPAEQVDELRQMVESVEIGPAEGTQ